MKSCKERLWLNQACEQAFYYFYSMLPRLLLFVLVPLGIAWLVYRAFGKQSPHCKRCEGNGYWKGVRGEPNRCEACGGKGY